MEFIPLSDTVLNCIAREDPELKKSVSWCVSSRQVTPVTKWRVFSDAYFVNADPAGEPGEHWLAIWTRNRVCEVFDSYGLPLSSYKKPHLTSLV